MTARRTSKKIEDTPQPEVPRTVAALGKKLDEITATISALDVRAAARDDVLIGALNELSAREVTKAFDEALIMKAVRSYVLLLTTLAVITIALCVWLLVTC